MPKSKPESSPTGGDTKENVDAAPRTRKRSDSSRRQWREIPSSAGRKRSSRIKLFIVLLFSIVIIGLIAAVTSTPVKEFAKRWSANRHFNKAESAWAAGDAEATLEGAQASLNLQPTRIETLRLFLSAARELKDNRIAIVAELLLANEACVDEDRIAALDALLETGQSQRFLMHYAKLPDQLRNQADIELQHLRVLQMTGQFKDAVRRIENRDEPPAGAYRSLLIRALYSQATAETDRQAADHGIALLEQAGDAADAKAPELLGLLAGLPPERITPELAAKTLEYLARPSAAEPTPGAASDLDPTLHFTLQLAQDPTRRADILAKATAELGASGELGFLCRWLLRIGQHEHILEIVEKNPQTILQSNEIFDCHVSALIAAGEHQRAFDALKNPPEFADSVRLALGKALVARELNLKADETGAWHAAMQSAAQESDRNRFLEIAMTAQQSGEASIAADAIVHAVRHRMGSMPPLESIEWVIGFLIENNRPQDLLAVCNRLLQIHPDNPVLLNNAVYLSLILSEASDDSTRLLGLAKDLYEEYPDIVGIRTTLALSYLICNQPESANDLFERERSSSFNWDELGDSDRAIFALVELKNGDRKRYRNLRDLIDWNGMLTIEKNFFLGWINQAETQRIDRATKAKENSESAGEGGSFLPGKDTLLDLGGRNP